jgi:hypothetical protein
VFTGKVTIGSNSEFEEGYNPIELSDDAKDALAQNMGYDDYADMVAEATAGNTIIDGGYINTVLIEAHSIVADMFAVGAVDVGSRNLLLGTEFGTFEEYANANVYHSDATITNRVTGGNFPDATGWTAGHGSGAVADNTYTLTGAGTAAYSYVRTTLTGLTVGRVYAITARFMVTNSICDSVVATFGAGQNTTMALAPTASAWNQITKVVTCSNATDSYFYLFQNYASSEFANGKVLQIQYVSVIDLTEGFTAGYEPTEAGFTAWLIKQPNAWFDDTAVTHGIYKYRTNSVIAVADASLSTSFGIQQIAAYRGLRLVSGETYTLSFLVRGNVSAINYAHIMNVGADNQAVGMNSAVASATAFSRVSKTFIADANSGASTGSYLMISFAGAFTTSSWFEIQEVKLEKGNVVTDWCPAATETSAFNSTTNMWYRIDNERAGYYNATTDAFAGGLAVVGDEVASIAQILTNRENPDFFAEIGDVTIGAEIRHGIIGKLKVGETYTPAFYLTTISNEVYPAFMVDLPNARGYLTLDSNLFEACSLDEDGYGSRATILPDEIALGSTLVAHGLGFDATGPYYIKSGVKTYF